MTPRLRNFFLLIGVAAVVVMLLTFDMSWQEVLHNVRRAGLWLPAVILLWLPIYMINAKAWQVLVNNGEEDRIGFWRILKYTVSGFALNAVTPVGLLGGEPYRIMELTPHVGTARATSSVILHAMMHIFSHFWFWTFSIILYLVGYHASITPAVALMLLAIAAFCGLGIYFFLQGYRDGLAMRMLRFFGRWPLLGHRVQAFAKAHQEGIRRVDEQIASLHAQRRSTFYTSLLLEFAARMLGCVELLFILFIFTTDVSYWDCVLMQAFASLFANLMFFIPMQMGTREGGLALVVDSLNMHGIYGVLTGLITRLRELVWVCIGLLLIRIGNKR